MFTNIPGSLNKPNSVVIDSLLKLWKYLDFLGKVYCIGVRNVVMNCTKFEVRSFIPQLLRRVHQKNWAAPAYAQAPFSLKIVMGSCSDGPGKCTGLS